MNDKVPESVVEKRHPSGGSRKGIPNKVTADLRKMILAALDEAGGVDYLRKQASESPAAFLSLVGKCLPKEIVGAEGAALFPTDITVRLVRP